MLQDSQSGYHAVENLVAFLQDSTQGKEWPAVQISVVVNAHDAKFIEQVVWF